MKKPIQFGKYLLLDRINVGGMAEVFMAKAYGADGFERLMAIKKILPTMVEDEEFITMFLDEARISVQLNHPNVVQIHELGKQDENFYIAMDYVAGKDLRTILERYRRRREIMPTAMAVFLGMKMAEGLDYAHKKKDARGMDLNIVHRDVSPQNILVSYDGDVKIIDFGIAKAANRAQKTQAGILKGKFGYMSPEQVRGLPIDRRSDIFALGVVIFEMLTGEKLFAGESDFSTLEKVRNAEVPSPRGYNSNIPPALEKVAFKALAREVEDRYQWGSELAEDLMRFLMAGDAVYGQKQLAGFMAEAFAEDLMRERKKVEQFADMKPPAPAGGPVAEPPGAKDPTARSAPKYSTPPKVAAAPPGSVDATLPPSRGRQPTAAPVSSKPALKAAPGTPANGSPTARKVTGPADPVAAALAELEGGPHAPAPAPKAAKPAPQPGSNDPNNPYIPPPSEEEMAEMGTSDRTEIFRPAFDPDAAAAAAAEAAKAKAGNGAKGPVALAPPKQAVAPLPRESTDAGDEGANDPDAPGQSNATMIGAPAPVFAEEERETIMNAPAPALAPPRKTGPAPQVPARPRPADPPNPRTEAAREALPDDPEADEATSAPPPRVGRNGALAAPETVPVGRKAPTRPGPALKPAPLPEVEPAEDEEPPEEERAEGEPGPDEEPQPDDEMPPPPAGGGKARVPLIVGGTALAVVVVAVAGYFGLAAIMGGGSGAIIVSVDPPNTPVTLAVDGKPATPGLPVTLPPGPHKLSLKMAGAPEQLQEVKLEKGQTQTVQFKLQVPEQAKPPEPKPPEPKPEEAPKPPEPKPDAIAAKPEPQPEPEKPPEKQPEPPKAPDKPKASKTFSVNVTSDPPGALVKIGPTKSVVTPGLITDLDKAKYYPVTATLKGYKSPVGKQLRWDKKSDEMALDLKLVPEPEKAAPRPKEPPAPKPEPQEKPKAEKPAPKGLPPVKGSPGFLICSSKPVAKVLVDGRDSGLWTPIPQAKALKLSAGNHKITLDTGKGAKVEIPITIVAGETFKLLGVDVQ